jgi:hypothetical protein
MAWAMERRGGWRASAYRTLAKRRLCAEPRPLVLLAWPGLEREREWEEKDGGRLKKPLTCESHMSMR